MPASRLLPRFIFLSIRILIFAPSLRGGGGPRLKGIVNCSGGGGAPLILNGLPQYTTANMLAQSNPIFKASLKMSKSKHTRKLAPHMALFPCRLLHNLSAANLLYPLASQLAMPGSQKSPRSLPIKIQAGLRCRGLHRLFGSLGCCRLLAVLQGISKSFQVWMVDGVCPASASTTFSQGSGSKSSALARAATPAASLAASPGAGASQDQLPNGVKDLAHQCQNSLESRLGLLNALASRFWLGPRCAFSCHMLCDLPRCQFCIYVLPGHQHPP